MVALAQGQKTVSPAVPAAKSAVAPKMKKGSRLERLGKRVIFSQSLFTKAFDELKGQQERVSAEEKADPILRDVVTQGAAVLANIERMKASMFRLAEIKWEPKSGTRSFRTGDLVSIKAKRMERFTKHGAFPAADLRNCVVSSVHGDSAKLTTAKKESLGLVPLNWLIAGDK